MQNSEANNLKAVFGPGVDCPSIHDLEMVLGGRRGEDARRAAESHLTACAHCRSELALLREFESGAIRPEERLDVNWIAARLRSRVAAPRRWWSQLWTIRVLAPAAAAAFVAVLVVGLQMRRTAMEPIAFSPRADVMRSRSMTAVSPLGDVTTVPVELQWHPVDGASRYRVRMTEVDRTELWRSDTRGFRIAIPTAIREKILPRKTVLWEVTALDSSDNVLATSGLQHFRIGNDTGR